MPLWPDGLVGDSARVPLHLGVPLLVNGQLVGDEGI